METKRFTYQCRSCVTWFHAILAVAVWFLIVSTTGSTSLFAVDNLIDHNGLVLTTPRLFVIYWGADWQSGFNDAYSGLPSVTYQSYLESFLNGVGGGRWLGTQMQYRNSTSPQGVIAGKWVDATNFLPATPTQGQIEEEVRRAAEHFNVSSDPQAVHLIALPPGHGDTLFVGKGGGACAWHSRAWNNNIFNSRFYPYITLPYMPDAPGKNVPGCWAFSVNNGFDFSGHGIFDGVSKVAGHEWAETLTDPRIDAWYDDIWNNLNKDGGETGDKCNGMTINNIGAGGDYFAVQPLWSNNDGGCVLAGVPSADQSPASNDFGQWAVNTSTPPSTVQLTNNGDLDLPLVLFNKSPWYLSGPNANDFILGNNTCGKVLHPGVTCQVEVTFRPLDLGIRQATLAVNIQGGVTHTGNATSLTGKGVPQWMFVDQSMISFGSSLINSPSAPLSVNLGNQGDASRLIQGVRLGGPNASDFSILSDGCTDHLLGPLETCTIVLGFMPICTGERLAELGIADATGSVSGIPVRGTGLGPVARLSAPNVVFDGIKFNSNGVLTGGEIPVTGEVQKNVTFTNVGQSPLEVKGVEVTGDFALESNDCTQPLEPNGSCNIQVRLRPTRFEFQSGSLLIHDNTCDSPQEVILTGSVDAPIASLVADMLRFEPVPVGSTSGPQAVELENLEGDAPLHVQSISATGDFAATSDCPTDLAIGRCTIMVTMKPTATGPRSGTLVVTDNAPGSPQHIPLVGTGETSLCVGSTFGEPGQRVTVPVTLDNGDGVAGFQADLGFDPSLLNPVGVRLGADTTGDGWFVTSAVVGFGQLRLLGSDNPPAGLPAGAREVALVDFDISTAAPYGPLAPFSLSNCILSDAQGQRIPCDPCPAPGRVTVRPASSFRFRPIDSPVGVDQFDPLPFPAGVEALTSFGAIATAYNGTANLSVGPVCAGTLAPATQAFSSGVGSNLFRIACCLDPLLPMTRTPLQVQASDPAIAISGMSGPFQGVAKADVNADDAVNVLDVLRAINFSLNLPVSGPPLAPPLPFQRWAANMLDQNCAVDALINVLDVVRIRNKALGRPPLCPCSAGGVGVLAEQAAVLASPVMPFSISVERAGARDYLVTVHGAVDVSGLQLEVKAAGPKATVSLEGLTAGRNWQATTTLDQGVLRIVAFSNDAAGVSGDGAVLRIKGVGSPHLAAAVAADSQGREIPVRGAP